MDSSDPKSFNILILSLLFFFFWYFKVFGNLTFFVSSYDIEECKSCECDKLNFGSSYGNSLPLSNTRCVRRTSRFQEVMYEFTRDAFPDENADGRNIWFRFVSDDTNHYKGFNFSYIVKSDSRKLISAGKVLPLIFS